jgi:SCP-2 sterol transfer family
MARYLSPEWVDSFDEMLSALDLSGAMAEAADTSLAAADGAFAVAQEVTGAPADLGSARADAGGGGSVVRTVLRVSNGKARLQLDPEGSLDADVTLVVGYADASAMALGRLEPADALAAGRVRVRGDLSALVAAQSVLASASEQLGPALTALTDPA